MKTKLSKWFLPPAQSYCGGMNTEYPGHSCGDACVREGALVAAGICPDLLCGSADHVSLILSYSEQCEVLVYNTWESEDSTKVGQYSSMAYVFKLDAQGSSGHRMSLIPTSYRSIGAS